MGRRKPTKVEILFDYIQTLRGKCESITDFNKGLIMQYCRFTNLADETSLQVEQAVKDGESAETIEGMMKNYERFLKTSLNLYKVLKFENIKNELASEQNPYRQLIQENNQDEDF